ncbi:MAG: pilus assembly protein [Rhizobiales bacterium]|nr:pilus assembly protein [Hyphomicrobiales bacterium]
MTRWRRLRQDQKGSVLVEFAIVLPLFLILLFAIIDFGQIYLRWILAEKATHLAARLAVVRPPVCAGVPTINTRLFTFIKILPFGTSCGVPFLCRNPAPVTCTGAAAVGDSFDDIFGQISPLLPPTAGPQNLRFTYSGANLGFLGGPYVPMVSVELIGEIEVPFITPMGPLLQTFYGGGDVLDNPTIRRCVPPCRRRIWTKADRGGRHDINRRKGVTRPWQRLSPPCWRSLARTRSRTRFAVC